MRFVVRVLILLTILPGAALAQAATNLLVLSSVSDVRSNTISAQSILLENYYSGKSGGGGLLYSIGTCGTANTGATSWSAGNPVISVSSLSITSIKVGMGITTPLQTGIPSTAIVIAKDSGADTMTLSLAPTSPSSGTIYLSDDNGGTTFGDSETMSGPQCFTRTSPSYGPREWGAHGDNDSTDAPKTTAALQNWLDFSEPHIGDFGTYDISSGLTCNGTTIQGPSNAAKGALFTIQASTGFSDTPPTGTPVAMIHAKGGCGLYGVTLDALSASANTANVLSVEGDRVTVAESSALSHGKPSNVICSTGFAAAGMQLRDSEFNQSDGVNLDLSSGCGNLRVLGDIIEGAGKATIPGTDIPSAGAAIVFGGNDITVANGIIEQSAGIGLKLDGASRVSVTGMAFDDNGSVLGGAGLVVKDSSTVSVSGNHFTGNGGTDSLAAQISFQGDNDRVSFAGNTYAPDSPNDDATLEEHRLAQA